MGHFGLKFSYFGLVVHLIVSQNNSILKVNAEILKHFNPGGIYAFPLKIISRQSALDSGLEC